MEEKKGNINQRRKQKVAFVLFPAIIIIGAMILIEMTGYFQFSPKP